MLKYFIFVKRGLIRMHLYLLLALSLAISVWREGWRGTSFNNIDCIEISFVSITLCEITMCSARWGQHLTCQVGNSKGNDLWCKFMLNAYKCCQCFVDQNIFFGDSEELYQYRQSLSKHCVRCEAVCARYVFILPVSMTSVALTTNGTILAFWLLCNSYFDLETMAAYMGDYFIVENTLSAKFEWTYTELIERMFKLTSNWYGVGAVLYGCEVL